MFKSFWNFGIASKFIQVKEKNNTTQSVSRIQYLREKLIQSFYIVSDAIGAKLIPIFNNPYLNQVEKTKIVCAYISQIFMEILDVILSFGTKAPSFIADLNNKNINLELIDKSINSLALKLRNASPEEKRILDELKIPLRFEQLLLEKDDVTSLMLSDFYVSLVRNDIGILPQHQFYNFDPIKDGNNLFDIITCIGGSTYNSDLISIRPMLENYTTNILKSTKGIIARRINKFFSSEEEFTYIQDACHRAGLLSGEIRRNFDKTKLIYKIRKLESTKRDSIKKEQDNIIGFYKSLSSTGSQNNKIKIDSIIKYLEDMFVDLDMLNWHILAHDFSIDELVEFKTNKSSKEQINSALKKKINELKNEFNLKIDEYLSKITDLTNKANINEDNLQKITPIINNVFSYYKKYNTNFRLAENYFDLDVDESNIIQQCVKCIGYKYSKITQIDRENRFLKKIIGHRNQFKDIKKSQEVIKKYLLNSPTNSNINR